MERLKKLSLYIIVSGVLSFFLIFEINMIETISFVPIGITGVGTILLLYSDYQLINRISKKSVAFLIFICSFLSFYAMVFMYSDYMDSNFSEEINIIMIFGMIPPFVFSLFYLIKHSKTTKRLLGNIFSNLI